MEKAKIEGFLETAPPSMYSSDSPMYRGLEQVYLATFHTCTEKRGKGGMWEDRRERREEKSV